MDLHCLKNIGCLLLSACLFSLFSCSGAESRDGGFNGYAADLDMPAESEEAEGSEMNEEDVKSLTDSIHIEYPEWELMYFPDAESAMEYIEESPDRERYMNGIIPRMLNENLEYATKLLNNYHDYFIVVDKSRMKVILFNKFGETVKEYGMACAKNYGTKHKRRDGRTPEGFFHVKGIFNSTEWLYTDDDGNTSQKKGQFGPRFIRLAIPGISQIGIHGTCAPWSIGKRASHGCIRLTNENILDLVQYAEKRMPVIVVPGRKDTEVNRSEGYSTPWISTVAKSNYVREEISTVEPAKKPIAENKGENADSISVPVVEDNRELI